MSMKRNIQFPQILFFVLFFGLFACLQEAQAQDCTIQIQDATSLYNQGKFSESIERIANCGKSDDRKIQWQSQRLLAMNYLALNNSGQARDAARKMLELNPRYKPSRIHDPNELVKLLNSIPIIPRFSFGLALSIGANLTIPSINDVYMVSDQRKTYTGKSGFQFGISSSYQFNESFALHGMVMATSKRFDIDYSFGNWDLKSEEALTYLNIPIMARYYPKMKTLIRPYAQLGGYVGFLMYTDNSFYATYKPDQSSYQLEHMSSFERRNSIDYGLCGGIGAFIKLGDGQFFIDINYYQSMNNITLSSERYANSELVNTYYYLDDDLNLNNLAVGIGYSIYLDYKVLKDKKAK